MHNAWIPVLTLAAVAVVPNPGHAGRPLTTEDAGVLAAGACEFEPAATRVRSAGESVTASVVQVACGTPWRQQFFANVGRTSGGGHATSFGLGGKTGLSGGGDAPLSLTLAYGLNIGKGSGGGRRVTDGFVNLVASVELAEGWTGHANLGWSGERDPSASIGTWNLAVEKAVGGGVDLVAEIYGSDRRERWVGAGARWVAGSFSLNALVARMTSGAQATLYTVGAKLEF